MFKCYHRAAQPAVTAWGGGVLSYQLAALVSVLMGHYSGLYPPPFRLGFHTGRGCAVGITLNKHLNTNTLLCLSVSLHFYTDLHVKWFKICFHYCSVGCLWSGLLSNFCSLQVGLSEMSSSACLPAWCNSISVCVWILMEAWGWALFHAVRILTL